MCSCRTVTANEESEQHVLPHALVFGRRAGGLSVCLLCHLLQLSAGADRQADQHLLANQVKLIFPVESNQLALSEDAEALVYVATGSDIYTQTEAEQL